MPEPSVTVPASLIGDALDAIRSGHDPALWPDVVQALDALLAPQPPTGGTDRVIITRDQIENGVREVFADTWPEPDETPALVIAAILARGRYLPVAESKGDDRG